VSDSTATTASGLLTNKGPDGRISFREALKVSGARIVTFNVSGNIDLAGSYIELENGNPLIYNNLTIDGSTAPNQGVQVIGGTVSIRCNNVIIRYMRFRAGNLGTSTIDSLRLDGGASNVVLDHVTAQWGDDGDLDITGDATGITVQWCILGPGFGAGTALLNARGNVSIHHNLFYQNNGNRAPEANGGPLNCDWVNNVTYRNRPSSLTPGSYTALGLWPPEYGALVVNIDRNYFAAGQNENVTTGGRPVFLYGDRSFSLGSAAWVSGNQVPAYPGETDHPEHVYNLQNGTAFSISSTRFNFPSVTTTTAAQAYIDVLNGAGAQLPCQDARDSELISHVRNRTGGFSSTWTRPSDLGGYPDLTRPCQ
jgi:pectate lyase